MMMMEADGNISLYYRNARMGHEMTCVGKRGDTIIYDDDA